MSTEREQTLEHDHAVVDVAAAKQLVCGLLFELECVGSDLRLARESEVDVGGLAAASGIRVCVAELGAQAVAIAPARGRDSARRA